ncbi:unnamed protein product [Calicophoron daubneyi]|uniref:Serine/threonine-protein phosphatase PGAM5, mitochondrial n=1 Tax=Calicophoron daubneyi TaxID=300641 RepID=A0AAV2TNA2_CALDB
MRRFLSAAGGATGCLSLGYLLWFHPYDSGWQLSASSEQTPSPRSNKVTIPGFQSKVPPESQGESRLCYRKRIIFLRHGQYKLKGQTSDEKVLTNLGWRQAYASGRYLKDAGFRIDRIVHSDLIRARQTTAAVLVGMQDESDPLFDLPILTNLVSPYQSELKGNYSKKTPAHGIQRSSSLLSTVKASENWDEKHSMIDPPYQPYPGSPFDCQESRFLTEGPPPVEPEPAVGKPIPLDIRVEQGSRIEQGFHAHIHHLPVTDRGRLSSTPSMDGGCECIPDATGGEFQCPSHHHPDEIACETILFIGHANVFRFWLCRALQIPPEAWLRIQLYHGSISILMIDCASEGCKAKLNCTVFPVRIGEVGYMPKELLSR